MIDQPRGVQGVQTLVQPEANVSVQSARIIRDM
jgi:hypothetical protein